MAITLNGSPKADVVFKGAPLTVTFKMPPGHGWLLEELEAAVRQKLDGVADRDRRAPEIATKADAEGGSTVLADEQTILDGLTAAEAAQVGAALQAASAAKPLVQDDFALDIVEGTAKVSLRGIALADFGLVGIPAPADAEQKAAERFLRLIRPFPRVARPFPGAAVPGQQQER
jgi:hypothetical protein